MVTKKVVKETKKPAVKATKTVAPKSVAAKTASPKSVAKRVTFKLNAPYAGSVSLAGDFNGWDSAKKALKKDSNGNWSGMVMLKPGSYQYKYVVDGQWITDSSEEKITNSVGGENNKVEVA